MTFRFLPPAEAELLEGISYYSAIRPELGSRFEQAIAEAVRNAVAHPCATREKQVTERGWSCLRADNANTAAADQGDQLRHPLRGT